MPHSRGYAQAADHDEEETEQHRERRMASDDTQIEMSTNIAQPNEFQLKSRGTRDFEDSRYD